MAAMEQTARCTAAAMVAQVVAGWVQPSLVPRAALVLQAHPDRATTVEQTSAHAVMNDQQVAAVVPVRLVVLHRLRMINRAVAAQVGRFRSLVQTSSTAAAVVAAVQARRISVRLPVAAALAVAEMVAAFAVTTALMVSVVAAVAPAMTQL